MASVSAELEPSRESTEVILRQDAHCPNHWSELELVSGTVRGSVPARAKGRSDNADGLATRISLAHGEGGPLGSHCATATYAALQPLPMTPARRRRFQRTTCTNAGTSQRGITRQGFARQLLGSAGIAAATNDRVMFRTGGTVCRRRRSWMGIGPSCGTNGRGQGRSRAGGRAGCQAGSAVGFGSHRISNKTVGETHAASCAVAEEFFFEKA